MNDALRWKTVSASSDAATVTKWAEDLPPEFHPLGRAASTSQLNLKFGAGWWDGERWPEMGGHNNTTPGKWIGIGLLRKALDGGPPVRQCSWEGNLVVPAENLMKTFVEILGLRVIQINDEGNNNGLCLFASDDTWLSFNRYERGQSASATVVTSNSEIAEKAFRLFERCLIPDDPKKGLVFALTKGMTGYQLTRLGTAGTPLERENYTPQVLDDYDHVVTDLQTEGPCGRLIVLSGTPGTGKTFLVRALLTEVPKAAFVLIPPQMVSELGAPEVVPALIQAKNEISGPIVLILEDGDKALVVRKDGDMNTISSLLNLGDGILGSILDIRILATTNAEKLEMDPATRRKGRLCRYIQVDALSAEQASNVVTRLTGQAEPFDEETTLADAYSRARDSGWKPKEVVPARPGLRKEIL